MRREAAEDDNSGRSKSSSDYQTILTDLQVRVAVLEAKEPISKVEFEPVRRIVWGAVFMILGVVTTAVVTLVIKSGGQLPPLHP